MKEINEKLHKKELELKELEDRQVAIGKQ